MKSTAENLQLWEQRINERVQSGMTIEEWCKKNGVSKHKYNYWNQRVRKGRKADEGTTFADITPILLPSNTPNQDSSLMPDFQIFFKSVRVTVPSHFNPAALAGLMKVLQEL